jgi:hypothetical protein
VKIDTYVFELQSNGAPITLGDRYTLMVKPSRLRPVGPPRVHEFQALLTELETGGHHMRLMWEQLMASGERYRHEVGAVLAPNVPPATGGPVLATFSVSDRLVQYTTPKGATRTGIAYTLYVMPAWRLGVTEPSELKGAREEIALLKAKQDAWLAATYKLWYDNR